MSDQYTVPGRFSACLTSMCTWWRARESKKIASRNLPAHTAGKRPLKPIREPVLGLQPRLAAGCGRCPPWATFGPRYGFRFGLSYRLWLGLRSWVGSRFGAWVGSGARSRFGSRPRPRFGLGLRPRFRFRLRFGLRSRFGHPLNVLFRESEVTKTVQYFVHTAGPQQYLKQRFAACRMGDSCG